VFGSTRSDCAQSQLRRMTRPRVCLAGVSRPEEVQIRALRLTKLREVIDANGRPVRSTIVVGVPAAHPDTEEQHKPLGAADLDRTDR
jgi:hypothetical protein